MIQFDPMLPTKLTQERIESEHMILALLLNKKNFKLHLDPTILEEYNKQFIPIEKERIVLTKDMIDSAPAAKPTPDPKLTPSITWFVGGVVELVEGQAGEYRYEAVT